MKKVRVTDVPLPGSVPKSLHKATQKTAKSQLSEEFVGVSSEEESGNKSQGRKSNIKKSANVKTIKAVAAPPTKPNGTSSAKRTYSESGSKSKGDSDSESEELEERDTADVPMKGSNSNARGAEAESEESASGSSSEEDGSGSGSSSEDSESEESESEEVNTNIRENARASQSASSQLQTVPFHPPPPFEPPSDFKAILGHPASSSNILKLFDKSSLSGKQIWHIMAPAGIPITSIKEVTLEKITRREVILNHKGLDYRLLPGENGEQGITKLLVPGAGGYTTTPSPISQTLNLQQVVHLPNLTKVQADPASGLVATASSNINSTKPVRQQPKGLRMRFLPSGFGDEDPGILGSSDSEAPTPARPEFRMPDGSRPTHRTKKRNHEEVNGTNQVSSSPVKNPKKTKDQDDSKKKMEKRARKRKKEMPKTKMTP